MDAVEEVKSRLSIEDVIGEYVELKRAGRNYKALSPFSAEKTPSFMVSPEKQIWHDFSSGKGGNIFSFVMEMEGLNFKEALEHLARKAGVDLSQYRSGVSAKNSKIKERLYECLELAAKFYQTQLKSNKPAIEYVIKNRKLNKETTLAFRIGYSPDTGDALARFLLNKKFTPTEVKQAGLGNVFRGSLRDMFRGRVMIPLMDAQGRVIGFTARLLKDDPNAPKYINTPQTMLYDKSRHVFGLHLAKDAIRKNEFAVVVEGNMDVIASHQAQVANVVATAGTAMTKQHLKEIARFTHDIRLSFDQDQAGLSATERTVILAIEEDIKLGVVSVLNAKDPDELIKSDVTSWQQVIAEPQYAIDWLIDRYSHEADITTGAGKKSFASKIIPVLDRLPNAVEREHYRRNIAALLGVSFEALSQQSLARAGVVKRYKQPKVMTHVSKTDADILKTENQYISLLLKQPSLRIYTDPVSPDMFKTREAAAMYKAIMVQPKDKSRDILETHKNVAMIADYGKVVTLLYEELYAHLEFIELEYEAARLQVRVIEHFVKEQKHLITQKLTIATDDSKVTALLTKAKELDQLLKTVKEKARGQ
jgi:DNA primase